MLYALKSTNTNIMLRIDDIIWSHSHWDHMGSPYLFPKSTNLCYGKGTGIFPAYPATPGSNLSAADFEGRNCVEIECNQLKIGPFNGHDFYGDGSLYLLDCPGHWPGHMCALARTTPDTFLFLGGDICHFAGDFRPSETISLPDSIPDAAFKGGRRFDPSPCPCSIFEDHHPQLQNLEKDTSKINTKTTPFYSLSTTSKSTYHNPGEAQVTTDLMERYFDSDPNVLVLLSHDTALPDYLPTFNHNPEKDLNDWKAQGLKEDLHWAWLTELPRYDADGKVLGQRKRQEQLAEGLWRDGKLVDS